MSDLTRISKSILIMQFYQSVLPVLGITAERWGCSRVCVVILKAGPRFNSLHCRKKSKAKQEFVKCIFI